MHQECMGRRNNGIFLVIFLCIVAAGMGSISAEAQESSSTDLSSIPAEWPDDVPQPTDLSNLGGQLDIEVYPEGTEYSISVFGAYDGSGLDYLDAFHEVLIDAGFERVEHNEGSRVTTARYQRGTEKLTIGTDLLNRGAPSEYTEIGVSYYRVVFAGQ